MKNRRLISVLCAIAMSLTLVLPVGALETEAQSTVKVSPGVQTAASIEKVQAFFNQHNVSQATDAELAQISSIIEDISVLESAKAIEMDKLLKMSHRLQENGQSLDALSELDRQLTEKEEELDALPVLTVSPSDLRTLGFLIAPAPPSEPADTRWVEFRMVSSTNMYNGVLHYYVRIYAISKTVGNVDSADPMRFHVQADLLEKVSAGDIAGAIVKLALSEYTSYPLVNPISLLGSAFESTKSEALLIIAQNAQSFAYDYVASAEMPQYSEMVTSERSSITYYYDYTKNTNGILSGETSPKKIISKATSYFAEGTNTREHAFALFDANASREENTLGNISITITAKGKTYKYNVPKEYYPGLSWVPGA